MVDLDEDGGAEALLRQLGVGPENTPVVVLRETEVLRNPTNAELARALGLRRPEPTRGVFDLLVVGAGPAGLAAVVYGASDGLTVSAVDAIATGGQAGTTSRIENYLGFPSGISGTELAERSVIQAGKFGVRIAVPSEALSLEPHSGHYVVGLGDGREVISRAVVIATGARYRRLAVPQIEKFEGTSVYYAATVHEARECRSVPGGGGGRRQFSRPSRGVPRGRLTVYLLVRGRDLAENMSRYLVDQVERHPRVEVMMCTEVRDVVGGKTLEAVVVENNRMVSSQARRSSALRLHRRLSAYGVAVRHRRAGYGWVRADRRRRRRVPCRGHVASYVASAAGAGDQQTRRVRGRRRPPRLDQTNGLGGR